MKKYILVAALFLVASSGAIFLYASQGKNGESRYSDVEAGFEEAENSADVAPLGVPDERKVPQPSAGSGGFSRWGFYWREFSEEEKKLYENWKRPEGPLRVGLQAGHWKNDEVPEELAGLERSGGGAQGGGKSEVDVALEIARLTKTLLEKEKIAVDLLPATVPSGYVADAFVSIHADGNGNSSVSGFKISGPRRDFSGQASKLAEALYESYMRETGILRDPSISRRMSGYYAFNWRRYEHAAHRMTPAVIIETGFMTSPSDRAVIVDHPDRAARGIAGGIIKFLLK